MIIPDPNFFSGDILISKKDGDWKKINNDQMLGISSLHISVPSLVKKASTAASTGLSDSVRIQELAAASSYLLKQ